ncbi:ParA family protein [Lachnoclostridium sp. Marseille-P6806]|uniref:ParA family protein n=1 Tax=Lachnoclostridium sp. Marseille-P6806 TaxID=2364793 RepID=UPI00103142E3|nr:AAA family ATPase [Lachnoclostridium sp. Marseille-P6806]
MSRIIAVANQKGGVGKTTTTINLSAAIAEQGKRVLVVDTDPQGNTTTGFGIDKIRLVNTVYELLLDECSIQDAIIRNVRERVDVIPANVNLAGAEVELINLDRPSGVILKNILDYVRDEYDFIIMDCPPSLNILTVNAMTAAKTVLVPIQCEYYALEGLSQLITTINHVKKRLNPSLDIEGIVFTMYDGRTNLSMQVVENVRDHVSQHIYQTIIPRSVRLAEAPSYGEPITTYDPKSPGALAYMALAKEVIERKDLN